MFASNLTIELGVDRCGELIEEGILKIVPGPAILERVRKFRHNVRILYDEGARDGFFGGVDLDDNPVLQEVYDKIFPPDERDEQGYVMYSAPIGKWWFDRIYDISVESYTFGSDVLSEALFNVLEYHGGPFTLQYFIGQTGEFLIVTQNSPGPELENLLARYQNGESLLRREGNYIRGKGMQNYAEDFNYSIWYVRDDTTYSLLISREKDRSNYPRIPVKAPWRPDEGTLDYQLWWSLGCELPVNVDPKEFYMAYFLADWHLTLEEVLEQVDPRVREKFEVCVRGYLGEDV